MTLTLPRRLPTAPSSPLGSQLSLSELQPDLSSRPQVSPPIPDCCPLPPVHVHASLEQNLEVSPRPTNPGMSPVGGPRSISIRGGLSSSHLQPSSANLASRPPTGDRARPPFPTQHHFRPSLSSRRYPTLSRKRAVAAFCASAKPRSRSAFSPSRRSRGVWRSSYSRGKSLNSLAVSTAAAEGLGRWRLVGCSVGPAAAGRRQGSSPGVAPP